MLEGITVSHASREPDVRCPEGRLLVWRSDVPRCVNRAGCRMRAGHHGCRTEPWPQCQDRHKYREPAHMNIRHLAAPFDYSGRRGPPRAERHSFRHGRTARIAFSILVVIPSRQGGTKGGYRVNGAAVFVALQAYPVLLRVQEAKVGRRILEEHRKPR